MESPHLSPKPPPPILMWEKVEVAISSAPRTGLLNAQVRDSNRHAQVKHGLKPNSLGSNPSCLSTFWASVSSSVGGGGDSSSEGRPHHKTLHGQQAGPDQGTALSVRLYVLNYE